MKSVKSQQFVSEYKSFSSLSTYSVRQLVFLLLFLACCRFHPTYYTYNAPWQCTQYTKKKKKWKPCTLTHSIFYCTSVSIWNPSAQSVTMNSVAIVVPPSLHLHGQKRTSPEQCATLRYNNTAHRSSVYFMGALFVQPQFI